MSPLHFSLIVMLLGAGESLPPGDHLRDIKVDGRTRSYLVHIPPQYDSAKPTPVVLAFHGAGTNAAIMKRYCGLNAKSDQASFIVVYPNGTGPGNVLQVFNVGLFNGPIGDRLPNDVVFVDKLLDELPTLVNVDERRIFATGISNGGMMCYRLAADLSERIAAIAPVAGALTVGEYKPKRPVSVIHFHGTADKLVPVEGRDKEEMKRLVMQSLDDTIKTWIKLDGCSATPILLDLPDCAKDGTQVQRLTYGPGTGGAEVVVYLIKDGGHTWPGTPLRADFLGTTCQDISANDLMWDFFQRHPLDLKDD
jgi:polyhydroxybutyrate depolymerase